MTWLEILKKSINSPHGIGVLCTDSQAADQAKRQLYLARAKDREAGTVEGSNYDDLSISQSPHSTSILYIYVKKETDAQ
jgi:hypothetical protein